MNKQLELPNNDSNKMIVLVETYAFPEQIAGDLKVNFLADGTTIVNELSFDEDENPVWSPVTATLTALAVINNRETIAAGVVYIDTTDLYIRIIFQDLD